jgi:hypothetical protein
MNAEFISIEELGEKIQAFLRMPEGEAEELYSQSRKAEFALARARPFDPRQICGLPPGERLPLVPSSPHRGEEGERHALKQRSDSASKEPLAG